jgi:hypothetical protein
MRLSQLLLVTLLGAATIQAYRAQNDLSDVPALPGARAAASAGASSAASRFRGGRPVTSASAVPAPGLRRRSGADEAATGARVSLQEGTVRFRQAVGLTGSRLVGPTVDGMTTKTEGMLEALLPLVAAADAPRRERAELVIAEARDLDEQAKVCLRDGQPVRALRLAMRSRYHMTEVRNLVREEGIR